MSKPNISAEVVLPFGDGPHNFALKWKQLEHLEKACNSSVSEIAGRVIGLAPRCDDVKNVIQLGLEGGGMPPVQVQQMMDRYFDSPLASTSAEMSNLLLAAKIMEAAWFGVDDIKPGELKAGEAPATE